MNYCPDCGGQITATSTYCPNCGQRLIAQKTEQVAPRKAKRSRRSKTPWIILIVAVAVALIATGTVLAITYSGDQHTSYYGGSYGGSSGGSGGGSSGGSGVESGGSTIYTPQNQVNLIEPNQQLASGHYSYKTVTIQGGTKVTITWSADASVSIWVLTETQYPDWTFMSWSSNYVAFKSGTSGTLTCTIPHTDRYYLIISRPGAGLYSTSKIYSAVARW